MRLGENIYRLRTARGMSQGALAEALGVSRQSVSKWETDAAVPELDKLQKLSALFGVSLDELVTGAPPESPPTAPDAPAAASSGEMPARQVVGIILLALAFAVGVFFAVMAGALSGLLFSSPLWACGVICLTTKRHPALWCLWALYLLADLYLRYATGLSWSTVYLTFQWTWEMNYVRLAIAWCQLLGALALAAGSVWRLGRAPQARTQRDFRRFLAGWALFALLCLPFGAWLLQAAGPALSWLMPILRYLQDLARLILLTALLTQLRRWRRK